jgi:hypothetical protein
MIATDRTDHTRHGPTVTSVRPHVERDLRCVERGGLAWQITTRGNTQKTSNLTLRATPATSGRAQTRRSVAAVADAADGRGARPRAKRRVRRQRVPARSSARRAAPVGHTRRQRAEDRSRVPPEERDRPPGAVLPGHARARIGLAPLEPARRKGLAAAQDAAGQARVRVLAPARARSASRPALPARRCCRLLRQLPPKPSMPPYSIGRSPSIHGRTSPPVLVGHLLQECQ